MFLKTLDIEGFKSFPDKTHVEFVNGMTCLVGPNGCGKSNIVDAIKWVLGEQGVKNLRAEKMEDVIFNGTSKREPLHSASVELVFDNSDKSLPIDRAEVSIMRKLKRDGVGEYYINRQLARLRDVRDLFADTGVGKSAYSVLEQGKIDLILSNKPEDRRYIFEEAAGISKYKSEGKEAHNRLEMAQENVDKVSGDLTILKRQYERLSSQATKANEKKALTDELDSINLKAELYEFRSLLKQKATLQENLENVNKKIGKADTKTQEGTESIKELSQALESYKNEKRELEILKGKSESVIEEKTNSKNVFDSHKQRLLDSYNESKRRVESLEGQLKTITQDMENSNSNIETMIEENKKAQESVTASLEKMTSFVENEKKAEEEKNLLINKSFEDANTIKQLQEEIGEIAQKLLTEINSILSDDEYSGTAKQQAQKKLEEAIKKVNDDFQDVKKGGSLDELEKSISSLEPLFNDLIANLPNFIDKFTDSNGVFAEKKQLDKRLLEINKERENNIKKVAEINSLIENLKAQQKEENENVEEARLLANQKIRDVEQLKIKQLQLESQKEMISENLQTQKSELQRYEEEIKNVEENQKAFEKEVDSIKKDLQGILKSIEKKDEEIAKTEDKLNKLNQGKDSEREKYESLKESKTKIETRLETIEESEKILRESFFENHSRNIEEYKEVQLSSKESEENLKSRVAELKRKINDLGQVNYLASEEYEEAKRQYDTTNQQLLDVLKAREDVEKVYNEITDRSKEMFVTAFEKINEQFNYMYEKLSGGGTARLELQDPDAPLESGIEIIAQPAGKTPKHLSSLSGGERTMAAVAILFATYRVKSSPFCILDEIDAALDDHNVGGFLSALDGFADGTQFIVITHNKHTVLGAGALLGVTQEELGVSKVISYRIDRIEGAPVIYNEKGKKVNLDNFKK